MLEQDQKLQNGRYTVVKVAKKTAFGQCYLVFDNQLRANLLLKEIAEKHIDSNVVKASQIEIVENDFSQRASELCKLKQGSLLQVKDYFSEINFHYLVVENIIGSNFAKIIENDKKPCPLPAFLTWGDNLLEAVEALHSQEPSIIHQEINPQNIFLSDDGSIKLSTLNIIQHSAPHIYSISKDELFSSKKLAYSPLEKFWEDLDSASKNVILNNFDEDSQSILEKPADVRSDIYSIGATFYYLLTAKTPIDSLTRLIDILDGNNDPLPSPNELNSKIPLDVSDFVMKALEIKRENRFESVAVLKLTLQTFVKSIQDEQNQKVQKAQNLLAKTTNSVVQETKTVKENAEKIIQDDYNQLEEIKRKLHEAEKRRKAAEKRAIEAENLLKEKEKLFVSVSTPQIALPKTHNPEPEKIESLSEIETIMAMEFEEETLLNDSDINEDFNDEINQETHDYFADLYEKPASSSHRSYLKYVAVSIILFAFVGVTLASLNYFNKNNAQTEKITSEEKLDSTKNVEDTSTVKTNEAKESDYLTDSETFDSEQINDADSVNPIENKETTETPIQTPQQIKNQQRNKFPLNRKPKRKLNFT